MSKIAALFFICFLSISQIASATLPDFTKMVKKNENTVVNVSILSNFTADNENPMAKTNASNAVGSGFIISKKGDILTNYHLVKNATTITVKLKNNRKFIAKLIGFDKPTDTALLKIEADDLPVVKIGFPAKLKVGEWVVAIGSPYGLEQSVTAGIVSAKNRRLPSENYIPFIQSDVVINPGNSGGPLFNLKGEVVGMNSQIYTLFGGYQGLSFAIPINIVMHVADQIKNKGQVTRGWMGIQTQDLTQDLAQSLSMSEPYGALISKIIASSPADEAGFLVGDVVIVFNGENINSASVLPPKVQIMRPGKLVAVQIIRQGHIKTLIFKMGLLVEENDLIFEKNSKKTIKRLGIEVSQLTLNDRHVFAIDKYGVLVNSVIKESIAFQFGIQQGDIILNIQGNDVWNIDNFEDIINRLVIGSKVAVLMQRQGVRMFLPLKVTQ